MRLVFMGSPEFAKTILEKLVEDGRHEVVGVFTTPDAISGRGKKLVPTPVRTYAEQQEIPVFVPETFQNSQVISALKALQPDCIVVASYRMLLSKDVLAIPSKGCLNVHPSLLPRWRGAAPIQRALLAGDDATGVCIMKMVEQLDAGPIANIKTVAIEGKDCPTLFAELAELGAISLSETLDALDVGHAVAWCGQDESLVMYAEKVTKAELKLDPATDAVTNVRRIRASSASVPAKALILQKPATLLQAHVAKERQSIGQGVVSVDGNTLLLGCCEGSLVIDSIKPDGSKAMEAGAWIRGLRLKDADSLQWERL